MTFSNPLGLLALLGIPAVLLIHFFQRTAKEIPVSTLFLLEHTRRESPGGRRFERLTSSIPLWLQLLTILLLTWLLAEPRFPRAGSVQRIAIVLDSSASMSAFHTATLEKLREILPTLRKQATTLELTALSTTPESPRLYAGNSPEELLQVLTRDWQPRSGPLDPFSSLRLARSLVSREGTVLFLTDTPPTTPPPFDAQTLSLGKPIENTGITGVSFETEGDILIWKALVKNFGSSPAKRTWQLTTTTGSSTPREIELPPGSLATLQSAFPADAQNVRLILSPDDFPLDDILPLVAPKPKPLSVFSAATPALAPLLQRITRSLDTVTISPDAANADLQFATYHPLGPSLPTGNAILFTADEIRTGEWIKGSIVSTNHPLVANLNWQTLLIRDSIFLDPAPTDTILVRQGNRPLIYLRTLENGVRQLVFNFDPTLSNIEQQPPFIVLIHRFAESLRASKIAPVAGNYETNQAITLTTAPHIPIKTTSTDPAGNPLPSSPTTSHFSLPSSPTTSHFSLPSSPTTSHFSLSSPGFLTVAQNNIPLLTAAFHFGDPRESDFSACAPIPLDPAITNAVSTNNTTSDPWKNLWLLLLIATLLLSWHFTFRKGNTPARHPFPSAKNVAAP